MKKYFFISGGVLCLVLLGIVLINQSRIDLWGYNLPLKELENAIIYTHDDQFIISDPEYVRALADEVSKMERMEKINPTKFCIREQPKKYKKLLLQTKDNTTYGGSFWKGNVIIFDSNGYYWKVTDEIFSEMDAAINQVLK